MTPPRADVVVPVFHELAVVERDDVVDGRRGLHLVSRKGAPASVLPVLEPAVPAFEIELPVLTSEIQGPSAPATASAPAWVEPSARWRFPPPLIALAVAALVLVIIAASLRWRSPAPGAILPPDLAAPRADAALDRQFAAPPPGDVPDGTRLAFPPLEVAPDTSVADRPERAAARSKAVAPAPRPPVRAREGRSVIDPAPRPLAAVPPPCTSNMAALGFCTLEPPTAKE